MSCSGLRYSQKIKNKKLLFQKIGKINSIQMFVVNDLEKYGVHMLEIINEIMRIGTKNYQRFQK